MQGRTSRATTGVWGACLEWPSLSSSGGVFPFLTHPVPARRRMKAYGAGHLEARRSVMCAAQGEYDEQSIGRQLVCKCKWRRRAPDECKEMNAKG
eukprot:1160231-Pelagomonas_calceolata.AAC.7